MGPASHQDSTGCYHLHILELAQDVGQQVSRHYRCGFKLRDVPAGIFRRRDAGAWAGGIQTCGDAPCSESYPRGASFLRLYGPGTDPLTSGKHVGQGHEVAGVDEGDIKRGLHGWLVEAREGFPGICSLHLCCGQHPAQTRTLEHVPG